MRVASPSDDRDLTALSHLHRRRSREKGTTGVASRGRSLIAGFTSRALCSERQAPRPEVTVLFAVGTVSAAPSAPGELGPSEVHNALVRLLPHRAMAPSGLTQALAPGSEPSARRGEPAAGDLRSFPFPSFDQAARGSAAQRNGSPLRQIACITTTSLTMSQCGTRLGGA